MGCRVIVEAPHRHHRKGKAYEVRIDLTVPGGELVINRSPKRLKAAKSAEAPETKAHRKPRTQQAWRPCGCLRCHS